MKKISAILFAVIILVFSVVPAFAAESPQASSLKYGLIIIPTEGGDGSYEFESGVDENGYQAVVIRPIPKPNYEFDHWDIKGAYTTNGKLTDAELRLNIRGDITVTPYFNNQKGTVATGTVNVDHSGTSPQTGKADMALPVAIIVLSVAACAAATLKLVKSK